MEATLVEQQIRCPFCGEAMCILLDLSAGGQSYVEDCQVCCRPMQVSYEIDAGALSQLRVDCAS